MNSPQQNDLFQSLSDLLHGQSNGIPRNLTQLGCISFVFSNCQLHQKKMRSYHLQYQDFGLFLTLNLLLRLYCYCYLLAFVLIPPRCLLPLLLPPPLVAILPSWLPLSAIRLPLKNSLVISLPLPVTLLLLPAGIFLGVRGIHWEG